MENFEYEEWEQQNQTENADYEEIDGLDLEELRNEIKVETLQHTIQKLRNCYATAQTNHDRLGFETILSDIEVYFMGMEQTFLQKLHSLQHQVQVEGKGKEHRLKEWMERYQRLEIQFKRLNDQAKLLHEEKEELRLQRDSLLSEKPSSSHPFGKNSLNLPVSHSKVIDSEANLHFVIKQFETILSAISFEVEADRTYLYLYNASFDELRTICSVTTNIAQEMLTKELRIDTKKGLVGRSFSKGEVLNIAKANTDARFVKNIELKEYGYTIQSILCYPLISHAGENAIGVLQFINKNKDNGGAFTLEDEAKISEYSLVLCALLDQCKEMFDFGLGSTVSNKLEIESNATVSAMNSGSTTMRTTTSDGDLVATGGISKSVNITIAPVKKRSHMITFKRIGHGKDLSESFSRRTPSLIPKDIEEYVSKLEQCWKGSVKQTASLQSKITKVENEKQELSSRLQLMEKLKEELELNIQQANEKVNKSTKELSKMQTDFLEKEKRYKQDGRELLKLKEEMEKIKHEKEQPNILSSLLFQGNTSASLPNLSSYSSIQSPSISPFPNPIPPIFPRSVSSLAPSKTKDSIHLPSFSTPKKAGTPQHVSFDPKTTISTPTPSNGDSNISHRELYLDIFLKLPLATCIITKQYRIWRMNSKFLQLLNCKEEEVLGLLFSDVCIIDKDTLPTLLSYDLVSGLGVHKPISSQQNHFSTPLKSIPQHKTEVATTSTGEQITYKIQTTDFVKVDMEISQVGDASVKYATKGSKILNGPLYVLLVRKSPV